MLVSTTTWPLQVGTQSAKIQVLVATSFLPFFHHQILSGPAMQIPTQSLWDKTGVGGSQEVTHNDGAPECSL